MSDTLLHGHGPCTAKCRRLIAGYLLRRLLKRPPPRHRLVSDRASERVLGPLTGNMLLATLTSCRCTHTEALEEGFCREYSTKLCRGLPVQARPLSSAMLRPVHALYVRCASQQSPQLSGLRHWHGVVLVGKNVPTRMREHSKLGQSVTSIRLGIRHATRERMP